MQATWDEHDRHLHKIGRHGYKVAMREGRWRGVITQRLRWPVYPVSCTVQLFREGVLWSGGEFDRFQLIRFIIKCVLGISAYVVLGGIAGNGVEPRICSYIPSKAIPAFRINGHCPPSPLYSSK